jgi:hypothetical protein
LKALKARDIVEMKATALNQPLANVRACVTKDFAPPADIAEGFWEQMHTRVSELANRRFWEEQMHTSVSELTNGSSQKPAGMTTRNLHMTSGWTARLILHVRTMSCQLCK